MWCFLTDAIIYSTTSVLWKCATFYRYSGVHVFYFILLCSWEKSVASERTSTVRQQHHCISRNDVVNLSVSLLWRWQVRDVFLLLLNLSRCRDVSSAAAFRCHTSCFCLILVCHRDYKIVLKWRDQPGLSTSHLFGLLSWILCLHLTITCGSSHHLIIMYVFSFKWRLYTSSSMVLL